MTVIAEMLLDLVHGGDGVKTVTVCLFAPEKLEDGRTWACRFEIGEPISYGRPTYGETSLQALALALKILSVELYGSVEYKEGWLGIWGEFGGYLGIPSPNVLRDEVPYAF